MLAQLYQYFISLALGVFFDLDSVYSMRFRLERCCFNLYRGNSVLFCCRPKTEKRIDFLGKRSLHFRHQSSNKPSQMKEFV